MKKFFFLLSIMGTAALRGQTGLTSFAFPAGTSSHTCIASDTAGNIWVGTSGNGIKKFDGTNWSYFSTTNTPMQSNNISAIGIRDGHDVWVGNAATPTSGYLYLYDGVTWSDHSADVGNTLVTCIAQGNSPAEMWFGTMSGLYKFDGTGWTHFTVANSGLASDTVFALAPDNSGNVMAGTQRGLSVQNGSAWTNYNSQNSGFPSDIIKSVYCDNANGTWISTSAGAGAFWGNTFTAAGEIYPSSSSCYPTNSRNLCKGPAGGVLFTGASTSGAGLMIEFKGNFPTAYSFPAPVSLSNLMLLTYNAADSCIWMTNHPGSSPLYRFDCRNYHQLAGGTTPVNSRFLDINNVKASVLNRGDMHWDGQYTNEYEVPKGGGAGTIFASALWMGGLDNGGGLHEAAMTYRQSGMDFFPGPLDTISGTTDTATAIQYDYMWKIDKTMILDFQYYWSTGAVQNGTWVPPHDILTWPAQGNGNYTRDMAPFVDVNHNGIYDPLSGGDYPDIKGDEMLYCIFNDNLSVHTNTGGQPLKVEVHFSAYSYFCPNVADSEKVINYTTFYNYKIFNRSGSGYHNVYLGIFQDCDLGAYDDDHVGCFPPGNFSYCYNDTIDGWSAAPVQGTYGAHPPISSIAVLDGPIAAAGDGIDNDNDGTTDEGGEKNLMSQFRYYENDFTATGNPAFAPDYYNYTSGRWLDSTQVTYGGTGYGGTTPTAFMFPGWPFDTSSTAWSEIKDNDVPGDRRMLIGIGPFDLAAGTSVNMDYADVFSRDTTLSPNDTQYFYQAWRDVNRIRNWYANSNAPSCVDWNASLNENANPALQFSLYPDPSASVVTLAYTPRNTNASYAIFDISGRIVEKGTVGAAGKTYIGVQQFSPGIYFIRITDGGSTGTMKFIRE
ncbi:MAG TPA: T9SS type A sorting domain-containing protein [Bacteroidia bacterium]|nr:T9SS type A sorting domain-containing protein [Bacteroidia bacterium]